MTDKDVLAEAKDWLNQAKISQNRMLERFANHLDNTASFTTEDLGAIKGLRESQDRFLQFAQTAALIAIAEALTEKKDD